MSSRAIVTGITELGDKSSVPFALAEYRDRLARLTEALREQDIDVYIGTTPENMNYFSGFDPLGLYFYQNIVFATGADEPVLLTHKCEKELARTQCWISEIQFGSTVTIRWRGPLPSYVSSESPPAAAWAWKWRIGI